MELQELYIKLLFLIQEVNKLQELLKTSQATEPTEYFILT